MRHTPNLTHLLAIVAVMGLFGSYSLPAGAQSFTLDAQERWIDNGDGSYGLGGTYAELADGQDFMWLFVRDHFGHFYLQYPAAELISDTRWVATNVRFGESRYVWAIKVDARGNKIVQRWVKQNRWGAIPAEEIKALAGYVRLGVGEMGAVTAVTTEPNEDTVVSEESRKPISPDMTGDTLLIADFEPQSPHAGYPMGGEADAWKHNGFRVDVNGMPIPSETDPDNHALSITHSAIAPKAGEWTGGGLILGLQAERRPMDLSQYAFLAFDCQIMNVGDLKSLRVKLEEEGEKLEIEIPISQGSATTQGDWVTVRFPLSLFARRSRETPRHQQPVDLRKITSVTFVVVDESGQLLLDNVQFIK